MICGGILLPNTAAKMPYSHPNDADLNIFERL